MVAGAAARSIESTPISTELCNRIVKRAIVEYLASWSRQDIRKLTVVTRTVSMFPASTSWRSCSNDRKAFFAILVEACRD